MEKQLHAGAFSRPQPNSLQAPILSEKHETLMVAGERHTQKEAAGASFCTCNTLF
jgi:hypothetical protein